MLQALFFVSALSMDNNSEPKDFSEMEDILYQDGQQRESNMEEETEEETERLLTESAGAEPPKATTC